MYEIFFAFQCS